VGDVKRLKASARELKRYVLSRETIIDGTCRLHRPGARAIFLPRGFSELVCRSSKCGWI